MQRDVAGEMDIKDIDVFIGIDVGKSEHWVTALSREGRKVFDKPLPNDEERLRAFYDKLADHGSLLVVVDQPAAIEALAVAVSLFNGSNRPGFDGGSDDVEGSLSWDRRSIPMSCASEPRGRALDALADPARAKGAIRRIADELGVHPEALRTWVKKAQIDQGTRPGTTTDEAQRIKELVKEVRELRRANAILKSASACLSRRSVSARPVDLPVHRDQEGGVRGLADLQGAHWRRSQDRPEHLTHARRSRPPSARSLRDETLKAEISRVHKNQLPRCWGPARCM